jgi:uncharacterized protein (DUF362 family)
MTLSTATRRDFLRSGAALVTGTLTGAGANLLASTGRTPQAFFGLHPFIEANPKAVFICRTHVPDKMDEAAKLREGLKLGREIFVPMNKPGVPVSHRIVLKPNSTSIRSRRRPDVENWGTGTDPQFYEGLVTALKEIGPKKFHFVEANNFHTWNVRGYTDINERLGVEMNEPDRRTRNFKDGFDMTWREVPDAVVYKRIPYYAPVAEPDTWLLNIAKWKAHGMCLTLTLKNEQGLIIPPFVRFCQGWPMVLGVPDWMKPDIHPEVEQRVKRYFENHVKLGYSRYESRAYLGPMVQEIWAHKTCDNMSVLKTGLAMIEGIYGRDGDGFGTGNDYLTNIVIFGKDKFRVDVVGTWLGGHEPGNVHLFRIAKERGLSDTFNPWEVPVFEWVSGKGVPRKLSDFQRTPLKTYYLQKPGEPQFHMVNEPFDYSRIKI